jgi:hypothetical protein
MNIKSSKFAVALCISLCSTLQAQAQSNCSLKIEKISWHGAPNDGTAWHNKGVFSIDVKNTSNKTITAVHWDFYLIDKVRQRLYDHFKFVTDDKALEPGKKIRLTKRFDYPGLTPNYVVGRSVIRKLVYSDGATWENPDKLD